MARGDALFPEPLIQTEILAPDGALRLRVWAEQACTPDQRARGLMFRDHLAKDRAMAFAYDPPRRTAFWMKNTRIPLDILFIDSRGHIETIHRAPPCEGEAFAGCPRYPSGGPIRFVIEIPGGMATQHGLRLGDRVRFGPADHSPPPCATAPAER